MCYGGNGIVFAVHAGAMVRAGIEGATHRLADAFGFGRLGAHSASGRAGNKAPDSTASG